jgi:hypothetical protein
MRIEAQGEGQKAKGQRNLEIGLLPFVFRPSPFACF